MTYQDRISRARPLVKAWAMTQSSAGAKGEIACPCCGGILAVARSPHDGSTTKTAAHCSDPFCCQWVD